VTPKTELVWPQIHDLNNDDREPLDIVIKTKHTRAGRQGKKIVRKVFT